MILSWCWSHTKNKKSKNIKTITKRKFKLFFSFCQDYSQWSTVTHPIQRSRIPSLSLLGHGILLLWGENSPSFQSEKRANQSTIQYQHRICSLSWYQTTQVTKAKLSLQHRRWKRAMTLQQLFGTKCIGMKMKVPFRAISWFCWEKTEGELAGHCFCAWSARTHKDQAHIKAFYSTQNKTFHPPMPLCHIWYTSSKSAFILASADRFRQHTLQDSTTVALQFGNTHKIAITLFLGGTISHWLIHWQIR